MSSSLLVKTGKLGPYTYSFDGKRILFDAVPSGGPPFAAPKDRVWSQISGAWALRSTGKPTTMTKLLTTFGGLSRQVQASDNIDYRLLLVQSACEAEWSATEPGGKDLKSPRTEPGYPGRTGEADPGDFSRDFIDYVGSHGAHSSHGLTQCLIQTAVHARPDLFAGVDPSHYRTVLWSPLNAFLCLARLYASVKKEWREDVVLIRVVFGAGGVYPSDKNRFGVRLYSEAVLTNWIAYWNDLAAVLEAQASAPPSAGSSSGGSGALVAMGVVGAGWLLKKVLFP